MRRWSSLHAPDAPSITESLSTCALPLPLGSCSRRFPSCDPPLDSISDPRFRSKLTSSASRVEAEDQLLQLASCASSWHFVSLSDDNRCCDWTACFDASRCFACLRTSRFPPSPLLLRWRDRTHDSLGRILRQTHDHASHFILLPLLLLCIRCRCIRCTPSPQLLSDRASLTSFLRILDPWSLVLRYRSLFSSSSFLFRRR